MAEQIRLGCLKTVSHTTALRVVYVRDNRKLEELCPNFIVFGCSHNDARNILAGFELMSVLPDDSRASCQYVAAAIVSFADCLMQGRHR